MDEYDRIVLGDLRAECARQRERADRAEQEREKLRRSEDHAHEMASIAGERAKLLDRDLTAARERIAKLQSEPSLEHELAEALAERDALRAERDRLQARVNDLESRLR